MSDLCVGGFVPFSTCDWPGQLVATVFVAGCPWSCSYCHNPHLRRAEGDPRFSWEHALDMLARRRGLLDGVVFSGGEPTASAALPRAVREARALGTRVGLHTGGFDTVRLQAALPDLDWIGFDAKAPFDRYAEVTGVVDSGVEARRSLVMALESGTSLEVRTTVHPTLLSAESLATLGDDLATLGVTDWVLQPYRAEGVADPLGIGPAPTEVPQSHVAAARVAFPRVRVRA